MKSSTGRTTAETRSLRAAQMPSGIAIAIARTADSRTSARVSIALSHWFTPAMRTKPTSVPTASRQPLTKNASAARAIATTQNGGPDSTASSPS